MTRLDRLVAWIVGPAALAAPLVVRAKSKVEAWSFVGAEAAAVSSTIRLGVTLLSNTGHQNAQSGVAMIILPVLQFAVLLSYASGVAGTALVLRRKRSARA